MTSWASTPKGRTAEATKIEKKVTQPHLIIKTLQSNHRQSRGVEIAISSTIPIQIPDPYPFCLTNQPLFIINVYVCGQPISHGQPLYRTFSTTHISVICLQKFSTLGAPTKHITFTICICYKYALWLRYYRL